MKSLALLLALFLASPLFGAPPEVPAAPLKLKVGEDASITIRVPAGEKGAYREGFLPADCLFFRGYSPNEETMTFLVRPKKPGMFIVPFWTIGEGASSVLVIDATGDAPVVVIPPDPVVPPVVPPVPTDAPTMATYVYEKDMTAVSAGVMAALNMLNRGQRLGWKPGDPLREKLLSTAFEDDTRNGNGEIPPDYKAAHAAATAAGLPALVIQAGNKVLRVVKAPTTAQQVLEAVP